MGIVRGTVDFKKMPSGSTLGILIGHKVGENDGLIFSTNRTDTTCPNCGVKTLEIEEVYLVCQVCRYTIPFIYGEDTVPYCTNCGLQSLGTKDNKIICLACQKTYDLNAFDHYCKNCLKCGKKILKVEKSNLCAECRNNID